MWNRPWGYKEGCLIGAGLLITGLLLQVTIGEINWSLFAYPVNIIVLVVYLGGIVAMYCLAQACLFLWMDESLYGGGVFPSVGGGHYGGDGTHSPSTFRPSAVC